MHPAIQKTFMGLTPSYYLRQLFFGSLTSVFMILLFYALKGSNMTTLVVFSIINALLYPYSIFVYESISNFIKGDNIFFLSLSSMFAIKVFTMYIFWGFAIFIAPVGLVYLYFYNSKNINQNLSSDQDLNSN